MIQRCVKCQDGLPNGRGVETSPDGKIYAGSLVNGKYHGRGTMTMSDGSKYDGQFKDGHLSGKGVLTWPDGGKYAGAFADGKYNGKGVMTWPGGTEHDGEFKGGVPNGRGVLTMADGARHDGSFKDGQKHGHGASVLADGSESAGEWRHGIEQNPHAVALLLQKHHLSAITQRVLATGVHAPSEILLLEAEDLAGLGMKKLHLKRFAKLWEELRGEEGEGVFGGAVTAEAMLVEASGVKEAADADALAGTPTPHRDEL
jgi:hypothetical protein